MKKVSLVLFVLVSLLELITQVNVLPEAHLVAKPLLIPFLLMYYFFSLPSDERSNTLVLALCFSWIGDVLLMFQNRGELYFMFGLLAFLIAHLFFIFTYRQHKSEDDSRALLGVQRFRYSFPILLAGTGLITILYPHLGGLRYPVMIYTIVIMAMTLNALFRFGRTSLFSFSLVFFGSILFMISDSMIAINKFMAPIAYSGFWVMSTYIAAQFLIVEGIILHRRNATSDGRS